MISPELIRLSDQIEQRYCERDYNDPERASTDYTLIKILYALQDIQQRLDKLEQYATIEQNRGTANPNPSP